MNTGSVPAYTEQQAAAIKTRGESIALSAGAGCGKTFVLTQRFLWHLAPGPDRAELPELVAITFTDKAAREMRNRIREACRAKLQSCPPAEVEHWLAILYGLDAARITTIHSFCASLLRSHAAQAGLDPRFAVTEAAEADALIRQSARDALHRLLEQNNEDAATLVLHFGLERSRDMLASLIVQRFRIARDDLNAVSVERLQTEWLDAWQQECVPAAVDELLASVIVRDTREWLAEHDPKPKTVIFDRCQAVRGLLADVGRAKATPAEWLAELREAAMIKGGGGKSSWHNPEEHEELQELWTNLRDEIDGCLKRIDFNAADLPLAAELTACASRIALAAWDKYEDLKSSLARLDFDDLLIRTRDLLRDQPDVAQRLAANVKLLMVDEFQDTDRVQAEMIRLLVGPALKSGKLFLVGDVQQSIYRFRRADPEVFRELQRDLKGLKLSVNFRSQPQILDFVNHLFAKQWGEKYLELTTTAPQQSPPPTIEFLWATSDVGPPPTGRIGVDWLRRREAAWIARRLAELLNDPTPRIREMSPDGTPQLRRVERGDIVILFRTLSDAPAYEAALADCGLDYYLVGGKTFFAQQEVFDLWNLCRWLADPAEEIALVGCLRSPFFNLSDDAITALKLAGPSISAAVLNSPPDWLDAADRERIRFAGKTLAELRQLKDQLPPSALLRAAIDRAGYDAALLHEYLGARKVANLDKLIRRAIEFDDAEIFTLHDFVRDLERAVADQTEESLAATLPEAGDVIRLMTIHQSKGLEFPVVILADMNRQGNNRGDSVLLHEKWGALVQVPEEFSVKREHLGLRIHRHREQAADAEEILRLLYVAVTRAADWLILSAGMQPDPKTVSPWMQLLRERFDLQTGTLKGDALLGGMSGGGAGREHVPEVFVHRDPPPEGAQREPQEIKVKLEDLTEFVEAAEPVAFPDSMHVYPADVHGRDFLSVSMLDPGAEADGRERGDADFAVEELRRAPADLVGTLFHLTMQRLDVRRPQNWREILSECTRQLGDDPDRSAAAQTHVEPLLARLIASPYLAELAAAKRMEREIDFVFGWPPDAKSPRVLLSGQIDVLMENDSGWHLLDYKTGQFPTSVADAVSLAPYRIQLGVYGLAAERQLGVSLQSISLVVMNPAVRRIMLPWNDDLRRELIERINAALKHANQEAAGSHPRGS